MRFLHSHLIKSLITLLYISSVSASLSYPLIFGSYKEISSLHEPVKDLRRARAGGFTEADDCLRILDSWIAKCPADTYLVVNQPGVSVSDFQSYVTDYGFSLWGELRKLYARLGTLASFPRLNEPVDVEKVISHLERKCHAQRINVVPGDDLFENYADTTARVITVEFPELSEDPETRARQLFANDRLLLDIMGRTPSPSYAVIYTSTTGEAFGTGSEYYKQRHLDIFSDLVRMKQNPHYKDDDPEKQEPMPNKKKADNLPNKPLPPKAVLDKQREKVVELSRQRKYLRQSDSILLAILSKLNSLLTMETVTMIVGTNIVLLLLYGGFNLLRSVAKLVLRADNQS